MTALTERFELRLDEETLQTIDSWRSRQPDLPSRAEAIRRLIMRGLEDRSGPLHFSGPEMLIVHLLCDLLRGSRQRSEFDPKFIQEALVGGHFWGLEWEYSGIFHHHHDRREIVKEVVDVLDMWDFIEGAYEALGQKDRQRILVEAEPFGKHVRFEGFDGNNEGAHYSVASFMVQDLGRFSRFAKRELNSHSPVIDAYRRMFAVFEPMRAKLAGSRLNASQIIELLQAKTHPSMRGRK